MDEFVDQTKTLIGALGWDLFRSVRGSPPEAAVPFPDESKVDPTRGQWFIFRGEGFDAGMTIDVSGDCVVIKGSKARIRTGQAIPKGTAALRQILQERGILQQQGEFLSFATNYSFSSPSAAAAAVIGTSANGRILWRIADGRTYADWEAAQNGQQNLSSLPE
jgi:hypothetical protein